MKTMKMKKWATLGVALLFGTAVFAGNYEIDAEASHVGWHGKKVTGEHNGAIEVKDGSLSVVDGKIEGGTISIDMQSITNEDITNEEYNQKLVGHLKSDDFFGVETYPTATLVLTDVKMSGTNYTFTGDLTIKGITKAITFEGTSEGGNDGLTVAGKMTIDRSDYNVKYGSSSFFDNLGDKMIHDDFTLTYKIVAKK